MFDVSHLGTVRVAGDGAFDTLQRALTNDLGKIAPGRAQYTHLLDDADASVLDDIIVWWHADDVFDVMPNASNTDRVRAAVGGDETTHDRAVLAVQGPQALERLGGVFPEAAAVGRFRVAAADWNGTPCAVAGTGYTGERGVEIAVPADAAGDLWQAIVAAGVRPAGLGARDTLRLEAGLPLHGNELGPGHHVDAGRARMGRGVGQARVRRPRGGDRRAGRWRRHERSSASPPRVDDRLAPAVPCWSPRRRSAS